jgi:beta-galactosidase
MEFWDGWFDWWGGVHHTTPPADAAAELETMLAAGASVNFYMFHGGTNFGLMNGANDKGRYAPLVTSYDYDAPLDEAGNPTAKYAAFRDVIAGYGPVPEDRPDGPSPAPTLTVELRDGGGWLRAGAEASSHEQPPTFDELGFGGALMLYEATLPEDAPWSNGTATLEFAEIRDLAWVRVDGRAVGRLSRSLEERALEVPEGRRLQVLVEDQGRVNYDIRIGEAKGIVGAATLAGTPIVGWTTTPIDVRSSADDAGSVRDPDAAAEGFGIAATGAFTVEAQADLFLDTTSLGKGYAFVNGFHLGRYWRSGPQRSLYVPAPVTRAGENQLVILELETLTDRRVRFLPAASLGPHEE